MLLTINIGEWLGMDSRQPRQSHCSKLRFEMPRMRAHGLRRTEGSFAAPEGNLSFQPCKMRTPLGTLTQGRDWMAITCVVGFAFPPWKIKMFKWENSRWISAVSRLTTSKQTKLQREICTFWGCREGSKAGQSSTAIPGRGRDGKSFWAAIWRGSGSTGELKAAGSSYLCALAGRELLI